MDAKNYAQLPGGGNVYGPEQSPPTQRPQIPQRGLARPAVPSNFVPQNSNVGGVRPASQPGAAAKGESVVQNSQVLGRAAANIRGGVRTSISEMESPPLPRSQDKTARQHDLGQSRKDWVDNTTSDEDIQKLVATLQNLEREAHGAVPPNSPVERRRPLPNSPAMGKVFDAARKGDTEQIKALLRDSNFTNGELIKARSVALKIGQPQLAALLHESIKAPPPSPPTTPKQSAVQPRSSTPLSQESPSPRASRQNFETLLLTCIKSGNYEDATKILGSLSKEELQAAYKQAKNPGIAFLIDEALQNAKLHREISGSLPTLIVTQPDLSAKSDKIRILLLKLANDPKLKLAVEDGKLTLTERAGIHIASRTGKSESSQQAVKMLLNDLVECAAHLSPETVLHFRNNEWIQSSLGHLPELGPQVALMNVVNEAASFSSEVRSGIETRGFALRRHVESLTPELQGMGNVLRQQADEQLAKAQSKNYELVKLIQNPPATTEGANPKEILDRFNAQIKQLKAEIEDCYKIADEKAAALNDLNKVVSEAGSYSAAMPKNLDELGAKLEGAAKSKVSESLRQEAFQQLAAAQSKNSELAQLLKNPPKIPNDAEAKQIIDQYKAQIRELKGEIEKCYNHANEMLNVINDLPLLDEMVDFSSVMQQRVGSLRETLQNSAATAPHFKEEIRYLNEVVQRDELDKAEVSLQELARQLKNPPANSRDFKEYIDGIKQLKETIMQCELRAQAAANLIALMKNSDKFQEAQQSISSFDAARANDIVKAMQTTLSQNISEATRWRNSVAELVENNTSAGSRIRGGLQGLQGELDGSNQRLGTRNAMISQKVLNPMFFSLYATSINELNNERKYGTRGPLTEGNFKGLQMASANVIMAPLLSGNTIPKLKLLPPYLDEFHKEVFKNGLLKMPELSGLQNGKIGSKQVSDEQAASNLEVFLKLTNNDKAAAENLNAQYTALCKGLDDLALDPQRYISAATEFLRLIKSAGVKF